MVAAHLVAERTGAADLVASANSAYVHGMGVVLLVCAVASLVAALLAAVFLTDAGADDKDTGELVPGSADARQ